MATAGRSIDFKTEQNLRNDKQFMSEMDYTLQNMQKMPSFKDKVHKRMDRLNWTLDRQMAQAGSDASSVARVRLMQKKQI